MKTIGWVLWIIGGSLALLTLVLVVPVIILEQSWWWFWGVLLGEFGIGLIFGVIFIILNLRKKPTKTKKINIKDAKERAIYEMKMDLENPDNFKIINSRLERHGEKGAEKTPILIIEGIGTETKTERVVIVNLNNAKEESTRLVDPKEGEVSKGARLIAEHPQEQDIREETTRGYDQRTGLPITTTRINRPSSAEIKEKKEKEEAEEVHSL